VCRRCRLRVSVCVTCVRSCSTTTRSKLSIVLEDKTGTTTAGTTDSDNRHSRALTRRWGRCQHMAGAPETAQKREGHPHEPAVNPCDATANQTRCCMQRQPAMPFMLGTTRNASAGAQLVNNQQAHMQHCLPRPRTWCHRTCRSWKMCKGMSAGRSDTSRLREAWAQGLPPC
jgi:hypothetical protein